MTPVHDRRTGQYDHERQREGIDFRGHRHAEEQAEEGEVSVGAHCMRDCLGVWECGSSFIQRPHRKVQRGDDE